MIRYPILTKNDTIGVTALSSGVEEALHETLTTACARMEKTGYQVVCGDTVWKQDKAKSAPATERADEFNDMMQNDNVHAVIPPWGGELLIETLPYIEFEQMKPKWILGYSDTSVLLLAMTLKTGMATAHGTNLIDLRGDYADETTAMWEEVLSTQAGGQVVQYSSKKFQKEWDFERPTPCVFDLTEETEWKVVQEDAARFEGRLLGGCIDVIRHLIGTPFGDVKRFSEKYISQEPIVWYFENCELKTTDLQRTLCQMKLAGWFDHCAGIMFGRSPANEPVENYTVHDVYQDLYKELQVPIVYDIDCGHVPPQNTLVNGAFAKVEVKDGKGTITQRFI